MKSLLVLGVFGALILAGCATEPQERASAMPGHHRGAVSGQSPNTDHPGMTGTMQMGAMCPAQVPNTTTHAGDVSGGAAVVFATTGDVAELRRRVAAMVEMHNAHSGPKGTAQGQDSGMSQHGGMMSGGMMGGMMMPASEAKIEETSDGARVVLRPRDPAQLDALRKQVAQMAERMSSGGGCSMMSKPGAREDAAPEAEHDHQSHQDSAPK